MTRLDQSRASEKIWWIIIADIYTDGGFILIYPALNVPEVGKNAFHIATELVDKLVTVR